MSAHTMQSSFQDVAAIVIGSFECHLIRLTFGSKWLGSRHSETEFPVGGSLQQNPSVIDNWQIVRLAPYSFQIIRTLTTLFFFYSCNSNVNTRFTTFSFRIVFYLPANAQNNKNKIHSYSGKTFFSLNFFCWGQLHKYSPFFLHYSL